MPSAVAVDTLSMEESTQPVKEDWWVRELRKRRGRIKRLRDQNEQLKQMLEAHGIELPQPETNKQ